MIVTTYGETTSEINIDGVTQYHTYAQKLNDETNEIIFFTDMYYLEADVNNVATIFEALYISSTTPTSFSADTLRGQRKDLLNNSDWTVMSDSPLSDSKKAEWVTYRQALRDITNGVSTEEQALAVTFPTEPAQEQQMAIVINGSGTLSGLAVGGLPDGTVDSGTLATDSVVAAKLGTDAVTADALKSDAIIDADLPAGSVLQVVQATTSTKASTTSTGYADTGLTASITPSSSSNKVLVIISNSCYQADATGYLRLLRGNHYKDFGYPAGYNGLEEITYVPIHYLDSPSTTSATTYKMQHKRTGGSGSFHSNYTDGGGTMPSYITLMEIAG